MILGFFGLNLLHHSMGFAGSIPATSSATRSLICFRIFVALKNPPRNGLNCRLLGLVQAIVLGCTIASRSTFSDRKEQFRCRLILKHNRPPEIKALERVA